MAISEKLAYIKPSEARRIRALGQKLGAILLTIGETNFDTPEHIKEYAKEALDKGFIHYTPNAGLLELREALAEKLRKENGIDADPEKEIAVTVGAAQALLMSMAATLKHGDEVLIPTPAFLAYTPQVLIAGGKPIEVPTSEENEFKVSVEDLEKYVTPKTRAIIINSPNNPTGSALDKKDLTEIADFAVEHDLTIISDEIYEYFVFNDAKHYSIASFDGMFERVITVNGFSKTYAMTGWRLGYAVAKEEIIKKMVKFQQYCCACAVAFVQWAALQALKDPRTKEAVERMRLEYQRRSGLAYKRLNEIEGLRAVKPKGAIYIFPSIEDTGLDDKKFTEWMLKDAKVAVVPGFAYGKGGENHVRMSLGVPYEVLEEALNRMESVIKKESALKG